MKISTSVITVCVGTLAFLTLVLGAFTTLATVTALESGALYFEDSEVFNATIPPIDPFTKTVRSANGGIAAAYSGEIVTYTIELRNIITDNYHAIVGITDTLPLSLNVKFVDITTTHGAFGITGQEITWTLPVSSGNVYTLTYRTQLPFVTTALTLANTAVLYEIDNPPHPVTTKTISATSLLIVQPWKVSLPLIEKQEPPPSPTPEPLPSLANYNFENRESGWLQLVDTGNGKLIYSQQQSELSMVDGDWYAWLGGVNSQINELRQEITITLPFNYNDLRLRYLHWIQSDENSCTNDRAEVRLNDTVIKSHQLCKATRTFDPNKNHGWRWEVLDLTAFKGQTVTLAFWSQLNASRLSNFFVDVVQLCSSDADAPAGTVRCDDPPTP